MLILITTEPNLFAHWSPGPCCPLTTTACPDCLDAVSTIREVSQRWGKHRKSIEIQIASGKIKARQAGSTWLIDLDSVRSLWGNPDPQRIRIA